ncbi:hypothetical protein BFP76_06285 [Amylibacter kogurei]|uniref:Uncharacterized protein n=1 Tax=Paramylibacter kogurei TaxID=1889778 RepID=A0A2G5K701_9RHOB|nr:hypothetical protein BFP76_06285 [Amylibacter kogurei]
MPFLALYQITVPVFIDYTYLTRNSPSGAIGTTGFALRFIYDCASSFHATNTNSKTRKWPMPLIALQ